jgi:hypothetical protein
VAERRHYARHSLLSGSEKAATAAAWGRCNHAVACMGDEVEQQQPHWQYCTSALHCTVCTAAAEERRHATAQLLVGSVDAASVTAINSWLLLARVV